MASEHLSELERYKQEVEIKLKDHQNVEQQKTELERHVQSLIKVTADKLLHQTMGWIYAPFSG